MNKRLSIILSAVAMLAAGCEADRIASKTDLVEKELTFTAASAEYAGTGVRTSLVDGGGVWWSPGDAISLFYGSGTNGGSRFTAQIDEPAAITNFSGRIGVITGGGEISMNDTWFWATYPYNANASCDGSSIVTELPSSQVGKVGTFSDNTFVTVARSQGLVLSFYNVCSGLKFSVTNPEVESVRIKSNGGEPIAGKVRIDFDTNGVPYISEVLEGTDEIVISASDGGCFEVGQNYYITMLPQVLASGFTVTFETLYEQGVREISQTATFKRAVFNTMASADATVTYTAKPYAEFEDPDFEAYCIENFDTDGDGRISRAEALAVTRIDVCSGIQNGTIISLKGIGIFENLVTLYCFGTDNHLGELKSLDVSNNTALTYLSCSNNQLIRLDVSNNTALDTLYCYSNLLSSLDVSNNTALERLSCGDNQLSSLDVSNNTALTDLRCYSNQLSSLDVSNNTALTYLSCSNNQLTRLDVSNNTALDTLYCYSNLLSSLDVSNNTALERLSCGDNQLSSLDVSNNTALTDLRCYSNQLSSLDVSNNTALTYLRCYSNQLSSLDVSNNTALTYLRCYSNQLSSLDVSNNTALDTLYCYSNQLSSLDISKNTALIFLSCKDNLISSLDVSKNTALTRLYCYSNPLSYLFIYQGQSIPGVTVNRSSLYIPAQTTIIVATATSSLETPKKSDEDWVW